MTITSTCDSYCEVTFNEGPWTAPSRCDGDPVPHSDLCEQHGGGADLEAYLSGLWEDYTDPDEGPCGCVIENVPVGEIHAWATRTITQRKRAA